MKTKLLLLSAALGLAGATAQADLIISQYVETNSGTTPKGIELWNSGNSAIDFTTTNLIIQQGTNGAALADLPGTTVNTGTLAVNAVLVIGTNDIGTYLTDTFGVGVIRFVDFGFAFNGNDSLAVRLGGTNVDVFGNPGSDPGSAWTGSSVSTANQNIQLIQIPSPITTGDSNGWTDPSERFTLISSTPASAGGLAGFGVAPIPEPGSIALMGLTGLAALFVLRRKKK